MTIEQTPNEPAPTPNAAPAPQPQPAIAPEVLAMIEAAKSSAYNAGAKDTRIAFEAKLKSPPAQPAPQPNPATPAAPVDALAILALRDAFDDATADLNLPSAQKKFLRDQVMTNRPADVGAYVTQFVSVWGPSSTAPPSTPSATPSATAPTAPNATPVTARPATPPPLPVSDDAPLLSMTDDQRNALARRIGNKAFAERLTRELPHTRIV